MSGFALFGIIAAAVVVLMIVVLLVLSVPDFFRYLHILNMAGDRPTRANK